MPIKNYSFLIVFLLSNLLSFSQQKDFGIWSNIALNLDVHKKTNILINQEFRTFNNSKNLANYITEIGIRQKIIQNFRIDLTYRFAYKKQEDGMFLPSHRLALDLRYKIDATQNFSISLRSRYQHSFQVINEGSQIEPVKYAWRNRIGLDYDINDKLSAGSSFEFFNRIDRKLQFRSYRLSTGLSYSPVKSHELSFGFIYQNEVNRKNPVSDFVLQVGYKYDMNIKKMIKDRRKEKERIRKLSMWYL